MPAIRPAQLVGAVHLFLSTATGRLAEVPGGNLPTMATMAGLEIR